ncbi:MAG: hypothetical protein ACREPL_14585 [Rhodanobacteraceae bacterium]
MALDSLASHEAFQARKREEPDGRKNFAFAQVEVQSFHRGRIDRNPEMKPNPLLLISLDWKCLIVINRPR